MQISRACTTALLLLGLVPSAQALEYPIGSPKNMAGMEVAAVYLQPVDMEPEGHMRKAAESDVHLEADIHALADNRNGFPEGAWIPYLKVQYRITKVGASGVIEGELMGMVASDGPHYGDNVKLLGPGKYKLRYTISAPNAPGNPLSHYFGRHVDRATGVSPWFAPFDVEWDFSFAGIGKKGGY